MGVGWGVVCVCVRQSHLPAALFINLRFRCHTLRNELTKLICAIAMFYSMVELIMAKMKPADEVSIDYFISFVFIFL